MPMSSAAAAAKWFVPQAAGARLSLQAVHASQSVESGRPNDRLRELGFYSLRRKIEDTITRAEIITSTALEVEETKRVKQEVTLRKYHLWDDLSRVDKSLNDLACTMNMVNKLKDLQYKVEEAKLITELADMDAVNHQLLKHAYRTSLDIGNFLDHYEMSKLLNGPYEKEGACVIIRAGPEGKTSEIWAEKLLRMYGKWAEKQGYRGRIVERCQSKEGGIVTVTIEFESDYLFGFLAGEKGMHRMFQCPSEDSSVSKEQESFDYDDKEDVADLLPDSIDLGIIDEDLSTAETDFNQALFDESIVGGEGLFSDYEQKFKNGLIGDIETMSFIKSPKNGVREVFEPAKSWEKAPQLVQPKYSLRHNIQQPR